MFWIKIAKKDIYKDWQACYQRLGPKMNKEGIITVGNKVSKLLKTNWNRDYYVHLPPNNPFTKLFILLVHNHDHSGVESTLVKL